MTAGSTSLKNKKVFRAGGAKDPINRIATAAITASAGAV
jgi:hypothetical protein